MKKGNKLTSVWARSDRGVGVAIGAVHARLRNRGHMEEQCRRRVRDAKFHHQYGRRKIYVHV